MSRASRLYFLWLTLCICGFVVSTADDTTSVLRPKAGPVPATFFGLHVFYATDTGGWPKVRFGAIRLWDAKVGWPDLEPERGKWNFALFDKLISLCEDKKVEPLLELGLTPLWASARPDEPAPFGRGTAAGPRDLHDWDEYVERVARRYKGRIRYYEIWNEANFPEFFSGTPKDMLALAQHAYRILKAVDPTNTVVSPSVSGVGTSFAWLDKYLSLGGGQYADIIGYHFYVFPHEPEEILSVLRGVRGILIRAGLSSKPIWNTEVGWAAPSSFTAEESAGYVARTYLLCWAADIGRVYWYVWPYNNWNTLNLTLADRITPSKAGQSLETLQAWLLGNTIEYCQHDQQDDWRCKLRVRRSVQWITWSSHHERKFIVPIDWHVSQYLDLQGESHPLGEDRVLSLGPAPILLTDHTPGSPVLQGPEKAQRHHDEKRR